MVVKANLCAGMLAGMLLGGLCVLGEAKPYEKTAAQESSSASQSSLVMGEIASDQDIDLMRHDLRDKKQEIIAKNLPLSEGEAEKFWPIYKHYTNDLRQINDEKYVLLRNYAQSCGNISNHDALIYIRRSLEIDQEVQALRSKYVPVVS